jgi:hypothetical protein
MNHAGIRCLNSNLTNGEPPAILTETVGGSDDKQGVRHMSTGNVIFVLFMAVFFLAVIAS